MTHSAQRSKFILGVGVLNWNAGERRSDRYGFVYLLSESGGYVGAEVNENEPLATGLDEALLRKLSGRRGRLVAHVLKTRQSGHIGDLFRRVFPKTPKVGQCIELGKGTLTIEVGENDGTPPLHVGIEPDDGREAAKLDVRALYRVHDQTVRLEFEEDEG